MVCDVSGIGLVDREVRIFPGTMPWLWSTRLPHRLHELDAALPQDALHPADGIAFAIQQVADAAQKLDILRAIVAPAPAPLHRLDVAEPAFPETQDVLRHVEVACDLANGTECVGRLLQSRLAPSA